MAIAEHVRDYLTDLAYLDQLDACAREYNNSPLAPYTKKYCKISLEIIKKRKDIRGEMAAGKINEDQARHKIKQEVMPLVEKVDKIIDKMEMVSGKNFSETRVDEDWLLGKENV